MHAPSADIESVKRTGRPAVPTATLLLALFVLAAVPAVTLAQGMDAAALAEMLREESRRAPARESGPSPRGLRAAVSLARTLRIVGECRLTRPLVSIGSTQATRETPVRNALRVGPFGEVVRAALLNLPPPLA